MRLFASIHSSSLNQGSVFSLKMSDSLLDLAYSHYEGLRIFLASYLQTQIKNTPSNQRTSAREKLTRLTKPQFADMSTDVFDEMKRRQTDSTEGIVLV